jgi:hypothetical protein
MQILPSFKPRWPPGGVLLLANDVMLFWMGLAMLTLEKNAEIALLRPFRWPNARPTGECKVFCSTSPAPGQGSHLKPSNGSRRIVRRCDRRRHIDHPSERHARGQIT